MLNGSAFPALETDCQFIQFAVAAPAKGSTWRPFFFFTSWSAYDVKPAIPASGPSLRKCLSLWF